MSRVLRYGSFSVLASVLGASYYYYAVASPLYTEAEWYRVSQQTAALIDRRIDIPVPESTTEGREYVVRSSKETMKDIWNEQIRSIVDWIYSWSH
ncbi:AaceriAFR614Wp [[Ashbya] aceris (nom. inval.)]|nr:AaceriAFR614Wp [[Ashbya] aceris (nom. inval.)]